MFMLRRKPLKVSFKEMFGFNRVGYGEDGENMGKLFDGEEDDYPWDSEDEDEE